MSTIQSEPDLVENYRQGGFLNTLEFGSRPALIVIDFVKAYLLEDSPLYGGEGIRSALRGAVSLLAAARAAGIPVFHTNLSYEKGGRNGGVFYRKVGGLQCFVTDGPHPERGEFADGLEPVAGELVITKQYASAFFGTTLASTLTALGIDTLIMSGVSTSGCVRASGVDCCQHGFIPMVVRDAVGDRAPGPHEANLFDLQAKYAEVVSLSDARAYLAGIGRTSDRPA
jgi:nicotinamidase-related amidase